MIGKGINCPGDKCIYDSFTESSQCPENMNSISYYWLPHKQKSCTINSNDLMDQSDEIRQYLQEHCRVDAIEEFMGCIFEKEVYCMDALENVEYIDVVEPQS